MAKTGRNQACPCGSGKKYKKCCLQKDRAKPPSMSTPVPATGGHDPGLETSVFGSMAPYVISKMFKESEQFAEMQRREPARARLFWTPSRVAALDTAVILQRLAGLGIETSPEEFRRFAETSTSAWSVSDAWRAKFGPDNDQGLSRHDNDFLGLAACELWKRWCPHVPSIEMLDDWMQEGYRFMLDRDPTRACDRWLPVWEVIHPRLAAAMRKCDSAAPVFNGTQCLFNWVQDFSQELHNAASRDSRYADIGIQLCEKVLSQFPDESDLFRQSFRADLGEFYFLAGRPDEGERVLLDLIRDYPDHSVGYARLADILASGVGPRERPIDLRRAQELLKQALARPAVDAADYDLKLRLDDVIKKVQTGTPDQT